VHTGDILAIYTCLAHREHTNYRGVGKGLELGAKESNFILIRYQ
jgi:hypothetical protein